MQNWKKNLNERKTITKHHSLYAEKTSKGKNICLGAPKVYCRLPCACFFAYSVFCCTKCIEMFRTTDAPVFILTTSSSGFCVCLFCIITALISFLSSRTCMPPRTHHNRILMQSRCIYTLFLHTMFACEYEYSVCVCVHVVNFSMALGKMERKYCRGEANDRKTARVA